VRNHVQIVQNLAIQAWRHREVLDEPYVENAMNHNNSVDFGTLYRAAFAERDAEKKQLLLKQVQSVIASYHEEEASAKIPVQGLTISPVRAIA